MRKENIPPGENPPEDVFVLVQTPKGSSIKYMLDPRFGGMRVEKYFFPPVNFPGDYGTVPQTRGDNGNPLDALVIVSSPGHPGTVVQARPIGILRMQDDKGLDDKLICVPINDQRFAKVGAIDDLPMSMLKEIRTFFETYENLGPDKFVKVRGWEGIEKVREVINHSIELYKKVK